MREHEDREMVVPLRDFFRSQRELRLITRISDTSMHLPTAKPEKTELNSVIRLAFIQFLKPLVTSARIDCSTTHMQAQELIRSSDLPVTDRNLLI